MRLQAQRQFILARLEARPDGLAILAKHRITQTQIRLDGGPEVERKILALVGELCRDETGRICMLPNFLPEDESEAAEVREEEEKGKGVALPASVEVECAPVASINRGAEVFVWSALLTCCAIVLGALYVLLRFGLLIFSGGIGYAVRESGGGAGVILVLAAFGACYLAVRFVGGKTGKSKMDKTAEWLIALPILAFVVLAGVFALLLPIAKAIRGDYEELGGSLVYAVVALVFVAFMFKDSVTVTKAWWWIQDRFRKR